MLIHQLFPDREEVFQPVGVPLLGLFPLVSMFLVTSITMLRERTSGTLERLLTLPLAKLDLLLGYGIAFAALATAQGLTLVSVVGFGLLGLEAASSTALVIVLAVANAVLGMALGLFLSAFARTEFQAVQFMPAFILPQILLCGLLVPRDEMAEWLQWVSALMPFTYAYDALARLSSESTPRRAVLARRRRRARRDAARPRARARRRSGAAPRDHVALTAAISFRTESFASPKSMVVFESR